MGRRPPQPKRITGKVSFAPSDGVFIGAYDIRDYVPLRVRIAEVVLYPAGTLRGGRPARSEFAAIVYDAKNSNGEWRRARRPLSLNRTNHLTLFSRFGEDASWWEGMEITLDLRPTRNPAGNPPVVMGIVIAPEADEATEEQVAEKMRRALRGECPYQPGDQQPQGEPEPPDDEPPEDAELGVPID